MRPMFHPGFEMDKIEVPTSPEQARENLDRLASTSRRSFLGRGLATAAVGGGLVAAASTSQAASASSAIPELVSGGAKRYFEELQYDEASHVNINATVIRSLGGTVRPYPTFTGITNLSMTELLNLSVLIANTGVGALSGAAPHLYNSQVISVAGSILLDEAYHAGYLNSTANLSLVPNELTYTVPLTIDQVVSTLSPYIVSLNDDGMFPATFSTTTKSTANDIMILNFALIIDYLEATLYYNNVPRLFN